MKQKVTEVKREKDSSIILAKDCNTSLKIMNRTTREKMNMAKEDLKNMIDQINVTYIENNRTTEYIFSRTDLTLGHRLSQ